MGSFINRKQEKVATVFQTLGSDHNEESFIALFKEYYPEDWILINQKWEDEERQTLPGKKHPMKCPDVYMKEMYRNWKRYY